MGDTDQCLMEVVEPKTVWIMPMGYEVDEKILNMYAQHLLSNPKDTTVERFGTYEELSMKLHVELRKPKINRKVRKEVEQLAENLGLTKEAVRQFRERTEKAEREK